MAIIAIYRGNGFTKEMYDKLRKEVTWETNEIDGWITHIVGFDESGELHMVNIWESKDKMSKAFSTRLSPVMQKLGIPAPYAEIYPVHKIDIF